MALNSVLMNFLQLFLREYLSNHLDREVERVRAEAAVTLQKYARGYVGQKKYGKIKRAIKLLQTELQVWKTRFVSEMATGQMVRQYISTQRNSQFRSPKIVKRVICLFLL